MPVKIGEALVAKGVLTGTQLNTALQTQLMRGGHIGTTLVELGYIDEATLGQTLAEILGLSYAPAEMFDSIPRDVLDAVPREEVIRRQVVPIGIDDKCLHLATIERKNLSNLSNLTGYKIVPYVAPELRILKAMEKYYGVPRRLRFVAPSGPSRKVSQFGRRAEVRSIPVASLAPRPPSPKVAEPVATPVAKKSLLEELSIRMSRIMTHAELGDILLDCAARGCERRILFAVTDDVAEVANSKNVELDAESLNGLRLPIDRNSIFALPAEDSYYRGPVPSDFDRRSFYGKLALAVPREILVLPIHGEERLEAVLYGDGGATGRIDQVEDSYLAILGMIGLAVRMLNLRVQLCPA
jgi:hypothetical protein